MNVTSRLCQLKQTLRSCRSLHVTSLARNSASYEGPNKTTVTLISKEIGSRFLVSKCDEIGFTLSNGMKILGPTVLFPRQALCWNITSGKYINKESLSLFFVLEPKPDLLIIGLDKQYDYSYIRNIYDLVREYGIPVEVLPSFKACTVFNFVNEEGRYVVAAMVPQKTSRTTLMLPMRTKRRASNSDKSANAKEDNARTDKLT